MSTPNHVYLDLDVINNNYMSDANIPLKFQETRNNPYLEDSGDYFCSIVRFSIQTGNSLPVFIPEMRNEIETIYNISIELSGFVSSVWTPLYTASKYVSYTSAKYGTITPKPEDYYYVYNYQDFTRMINNTFSEVMSQIILYYNPIEAAGYVAPYLIFDTETYKFILNLDAAYFGNSGAYISGTTGTIRLKLGFNTPLTMLLQSFCYVKRSTDLYYVIVDNIKNTSLTKINDVVNVAPTGTINVVSSRYVYQIFQELSCVSHWSPIASIVFTTSLIPVYANNVSTVKLYNSSDGQPAISNILTDFELNITSINQYRPEISYISQSEYRLIDMYSVYNLSKLDLNVFWKDTSGVLHPLNLSPGCSAHIKLMFRKKQFNI